MLSLETLEWCPYPCILWNSTRLFLKIIIFISFSEHKNSGLFFFLYKVCISSSFQTLDLPPILRNIGPIMFLDERGIYEKPCVLSMIRFVVPVFQLTSSFDNF